MIKENNGITQITCDKCGVKSSATSIVCNEVFFDEGWIVRPRAKKHIHLCYKCVEKIKQL